MDRTEAGKIFDRGEAIGRVFQSEMQSQLRGSMLRVRPEGIFAVVELPLTALDSPTVVAHLEGNDQPMKRRIERIAWLVIALQSCLKKD